MAGHGGINAIEPAPVALRNSGLKDRRYLAALKFKLGDKLLCEMSSATLITTVNEMHPGGDPGTKNRQVIVPAAPALHHAEGSGLCPWIRCRKFKEAKPEARGMDPELAAVGIEAAEGELKLLLTWLFLVSTRITETLGARLERIDRATRIVRLKIGKSDEWHVYALPDEVIALLPAET